MRLLPLLTLVTAIAAQKVFQGFNTGAFFTSSKPKVQSDFESEFRDAQALHYSPGLFSSARLYTNIQAGTTNTPIQAFQAAINTNTSLLLGIWCSGTTNIDNELAALETAIKNLGTKFTDLIMGISVGSEDLYRLSESGIANNAGIGNTPRSIVYFIKAVRTSIANTALAGIPVGHVDSWSAWANTSNNAVIAEVDFLGMDLYPYYEKDLHNPISNASVIFEDLHNKTLTAAGHKPVWITETGWPTSGATIGSAVPSVENAKTFWNMIACRYLGETNVWWYTLRDADSAIREKFAIGKDLTSADTVFNLTCPAGSGAPASINTDLTKGMKSSGVRQIATVGIVSLAAMVGAVVLLL